MKFDHWINNYPRNESEWKEFTEAMKSGDKARIKDEIRLQEFLIELKGLSRSSRDRRFKQAWNNREFSHYILANLRGKDSVLRFSINSLQRRLEILKDALAK